MFNKRKHIKVAYKVTTQKYEEKKPFKQPLQLALPESIFKTGHAPSVQSYINGAHFVCADSPSSADEIIPEIHGFTNHEGKDIMFDENGLVWLRMKLFDMLWKYFFVPLKVTVFLYSHFVGCLTCCIYYRICHQMKIFMEKKTY